MHTVRNKILTSLQNPKIKNVIKLRDRRRRDRQGLMLIEGNRELSTAMNAGVPIQALFYCEELFQEKNEQKLIRPARDRGTELYAVSVPVFSKISYRDKPDGLLAIAPQPRRSLDDLSLRGNSLLVVIESIEKPGNLGAILRSADAAGVDGVIVCDRCTDIYNPNVVRASIGTLFTVPVVESPTPEAIQWLKERNIRIIAATPHATVEYTDINLRIPCAILLGSEKQGLSDIWMKEAHQKLLIPMRGQADSLNVAMSATILLYEAIRQRRERS